MNRYEPLLTSTLPKPTTKNSPRNTGSILVKNAKKRSQFCVPGEQDINSITSIETAHRADNSSILTGNHKLDSLAGNTDLQFDPASQYLSRRPSKEGKQSPESFNIISEKPVTRYQLHTPKRINRI